METKIDEKTGIFDKRKINNIPKPKIDENNGLMMQSKYINSKTLILIFIFSPYFLTLIQYSAAPSKTSILRTFLFLFLKHSIKSSSRVV
jgi:hypothetical protein